LIETHVPLEQVRHTPEQSLRVTQPVHWLVVGSHFAATPVQ
jgi:hypothetical protein